MRNIVFLLILLNNIFSKFVHTQSSLDKFCYPYFHENIFDYQFFHGPSSDKNDNPPYLPDLFQEFFSVIFSG